MYLAWGAVEDGECFIIHIKHTKVGVGIGGAIDLQMAKVDGSTSCIVNPCIVRIWDDCCGTAEVDGTIDDSCIESSRRSIVVTFKH